MQSQRMHKLLLWLAASNTVGLRVHTPALSRRTAQRSAEPRMEAPVRAGRRRDMHAQLGVPRVRAWRARL